jgi:hypothetical protein
MKVLSGISVLALLIAGAATPSFATTLAAGTVVTPGVVNGSANLLADTGVVNFSFGNPADVGTIQEVVVNDFTASPFAGGITFIYQITVTGGNIDNLTTESFAIPGISIDVAQSAQGLFGPPIPTTLATSASLTSDGTTLGFGFAPPDGLTPGDVSYLLIVNTNLTTYQAGMFSLQDGQTKNFDGFVPGAATPEPSTLSLLGTGLLAAGAGLRRKMRRA